MRSAADPSGGDGRAPAGTLSAVADDTFTPLSASALWGLQRAYFEREGVAAWSSGTLPSMASTNAVVAATYARLITAFLRDWVASRPAGAGALAEPVRVVELGAGAGRLGYHVVRKLAPRLASTPGVGGIPVTYVLTDLPEATIVWWARHEQLQPLLASGQLDVACFDIAQPHPIELRHSGRVLTPGASAAPMVVVANYVLDSLPQDAFTVEGGRLFEDVVAIEPHPATVPGTVLAPHDLRLSWNRRPVDIGARYDQPDLAALLAEAARDGEARRFLIPVDALRCLAYLRSLTTGPLLLLSADKGYSRPNTQVDETGPHVASHGSVSFMVDYGLLASHVRQQGGQAFLPAHRAASLTVGAFVLGPPAMGWPELARTFADAVDEGGPDDFFLLQSVFDQDTWMPALAQLLAQLRVSAWDPWIFTNLFPTLMVMARSVRTDFRPEVLAVAEKVEELYFAIGEDIDVPFCLALLHWRLGQPGEGLRLLDWSARLHGPGPDLSFARALCHQRAGDGDRAQVEAADAARQDPDFALAAELVAWLANPAGADPVAASDGQHWGADLLVTVKRPDRRAFTRLPL